MKKIHTIWCALVLVSGFFLVYPALLILVQRKKWHRYAHVGFWCWAQWIFRLSFVPVDVEYRFRPQPGQTYIYCPNHASYVDIPLMSYAIKDFFVFVGKSSVSKIPLFGYLFTKMYIPVDRQNLKSRYQVLDRAGQAIDRGASILIFPEGGFSSKPPALSPLKEGAFRIALEKQVPIVPVSLPFNWLFLPDETPWINNRRLKVVIHEPVPTAGLGMQDMEALKKQVYDVISNEVNRYF